MGSTGAKLQKLWKVMGCMEAGGVQCLSKGSQPRELNLPEPVRAHRTSDARCQSPAPAVLIGCSVPTSRLSAQALANREVRRVAVGAGAPACIFLLANFCYWLPGPRCLVEQPRQRSAAIG